MTRFRDFKSLQKFAADQASIQNHVNLDRKFISRKTFKLNRSVALTEWRQFAA